ncbi:MAG: T9SS type A sorting domain-containing protein [Sodaliphilus sp.]|nr:T9SS type A sorting domain-containing protein [Bacteroidales bacterium]MDY4075445.1 T9SS type A sorting domain-containing protein [Sodaliphilus sp.]
MKKTILISVMLLFVAALGFNLANASTDQPHVYINPGHGGHSSDDRNVPIYPYAQGDTMGFWESNSNMYKCFALREILWKKGYKVTVSRETNTEDDDLALSTIVRLCNNSGADVFYSIHSNATGQGEGARVNFPMGFFRGYTDQPENPQCKVLTEKLAPFIIGNECTVWSSPNYQVWGDWNFQPSWGTQGYGVLRGNKTNAMLDEGSFHDYYPETYRLINKDYCWVEGFNFSRGADSFFGISGKLTTGVVMGNVRDDRRPREGILVMYGADKRQPVNGALVKLIDGEGTVVQTYTTDNNFNGIFVFKYVNPGTYNVEISNPEYETKTVQIEVKADDATYMNVDMKRVRNTPPAVVSYSPVWKEGDAPVKCNEPLVFQFNWDMDVDATEAALTITPKVDGTVKWEDTNYRMIFTPTDAYDVNTEYTVTLKKSAKHGGGVEMPEDFTFKFKTADRNHIYPLAVFPADGDQVHFKAGAFMEFRTAHLLNAYNLSSYFHVYDKAGNQLDFSKRAIKNNKAGDAYGYCKLPLLKALVPGEEYRFVVDKTLCDTIGLQLEAGKEYKFTAVDAGEAKDGTVVADFEAVADYQLIERDCANPSTAKLTAVTDKLFGSKAIQVAYTFANYDPSGVVEFRINKPSAEKFNVGDQLGAHVWGDMGYNTLCAVFSDENGAEVVEPLGAVNFHGWKYITKKLSALEAGKAYQFVGYILRKGSDTEAPFGLSGTMKFDNVLKASTSGINDMNQVSHVTVGPNPASDYIVAAADALIEKVVLFNTKGQLVAANGANFVNVADMASGMYVLKVYVSGQVSTHKVMVMH